MQKFTEVIFLLLKMDKVVLPPITTLQPLHQLSKLVYISTINQLDFAAASLFGIQTEPVKSNTKFTKQVSTCPSILPSYPSTWLHADSQEIDGLKLPGMSTKETRSLESI